MIKSIEKRLLSANNTINNVSIIWINIFVLSIIIGSFFIYNFHRTIFYELQGLHIWRQADCLSFSFSYNQFDNPFFEPRLLNLGLAGNGKTVSDFPLIYYLQSFFWQIPNTHVILKLMGLLLTGFTIFYLYKSLNKWIKDPFTSVFASLTLLTIPTYSFYSSTYLMNSYALNLSLISICLFASGYSKGSKRILLIAFIILVISNLLKVTTFANTIILFILTTFVKTFPRISTKIASLFFIIAMFSLFTWIHFAVTYNNQNNSGMFLTSILPIWALTLHETSAILNHLIIRFNSLYPPLSLILVGTTCIILFQDAFKQNFNNYIKSPETVAAILYFAMFIAFVLLFFQVLDQHDYYFVEWSLLPTICIIFLFLKIKSIKNIFILTLFRVLLVIFFIDSYDNAYRRIESKYTGWSNRFYTDYLVHFQELSIRNIIPEGKRIFVPSDNTINSTLITLKREGLTGYNHIEAHRPTSFLNSLGIEYLIIHDKKDVNNIFIKNLIQSRTPLFQTGPLRVYKIYPPLAPS